MSRFRATAKWRSDWRRYRGKHRAKGVNEVALSVPVRCSEHGHGDMLRYARWRYPRVCKVSIVQPKAVHITGGSPEALGRLDRWP